ncbi:MAG TPA: hypothetical protein PLA92_11805 [Fimbriimonadaceae bacterium]|nr:hypothetical protein [Fimbriimonadaceae bacterium]
MKDAWKLRTAALAGIVVPAVALGQVPDVVDALDAGGRAMGLGGAIYQTGADTVSTALNPAGLGFVNRPTVGFAGRTLPTTRTTVTGEVSDLRLSTAQEGGDYKLTHLGYSAPTRGSKSAFGIAYTVVGWMNDTQAGQNLDNGVQSYFDHAKVKTDFLTLGYGQSNGSQSLSWGFQLIVALQSIDAFQRIVFSDSNIPPQEAESHDKGTGVGGAFGLMFAPPSQSHMTIGLTVRSPIEVQRGGPGVDLYPTIPGRAALGIALLQDGYRDGRDSMLYGGQIEYYYGGKGSSRVNRKDHFAGGIGFEYLYMMGDATIPVRAGFRFVEAGGDDFTSSQGFTYGVGYRPLNADWGIDVSFAKQNKGGTATSVSFSYRLPN